MFLICISIFIFIPKGLSLNIKLTCPYSPFYFLSCNFAPDKIIVANNNNSNKMNNCLTGFESPQLHKLHRGKVRDSFRINDTTRMIVVTDRISAFNKNLKTAIPTKGAVLNGISNFWFDKTKDIIDNHMIEVVDPCINLVHEAVPIRVEMIVRAYITGSMWRGYAKGQRNFCGVEVPDGLAKHDQFPSPILTPTTKDKYDSEITPDKIVETGLIDADTYQLMADKALELFARGAEYLRSKGIVLVDTKYEFGLLDGKLILIDEIHTPDSSRFWSLADYEANPSTCEQIDKEFVRQWMLANKVDGEVPDSLSDEVIAETVERYQQIFETLTETKLVGMDEDVKARMTRNLVKAGVIKDGYVAIIMGSKSDLTHCNKIAGYIEKYGIKADLRIVSAHKNGERIGGMAQVYNNSIEPGAIIAVAGRSNGLGGALAANMNIPVINCPPFSDKVDMMVNINSSLVMPSKTPAATVVHVDNAAYAAMRSLNIPRLRMAFSQDIADLKAGLLAADNEVRSV